MAVFVTCVTQTLYRLSLKQPLLVAEAAKFELVRPDVLGEVSRGNARWTRLKHQHRQTPLRKLFGDPSAAGAGSNHENVKDSLTRSDHAAASLAKTRPLA